ncbi:hypothetical protein FDUTEX481_06242 [Tolypothrix sp. PCC 7601]|nr:hypothetical protein FDUTEX481_06242 [Tolypothrix sp. PCC 7601]
MFSLPLSSCHFLFYQQLLSRKLTASLFEPINFIERTHLYQA